MKDCSGCVIVEQTLVVRITRVFMKQIKHEQNPSAFKT